MLFCTSLSSSTAAGISKSRHLSAFSCPRPLRQDGAGYSKNHFSKVSGWDHLPPPLFFVALILVRERLIKPRAKRNGWWTVRLIMPMACPVRGRDKCLGVKVRKSRFRRADSWVGCRLNPRHRGQQIKQSQSPEKRTHRKRENNFNSQIRPRLTVLLGSYFRRVEVEFFSTDFRLRHLSYRTNTQNSWKV